MGTVRNTQNTYLDCGDADRFATSTISPECEVSNILVGHRVALLASAVWPTASKALFFPFTVTGRAAERPVAITGFILMNGAVVSGNVDIGVYDKLGNRLASVGSTAQAGTTAPQRINLATPLQLKPGRYYLAIAMDNITGTTVSAAPIAQAIRGAGMRELAAAFPLPASAAAWVGSATAYVPWVASVEQGNT
jgi:hypothetical protein